MFNLRMVVLDSRNENGTMLLDTLLGLAVFMVCSLFVLPIYIGMQHYASQQQLNLHTSQVLYSAAKFVEQTGQTSGVQTIEGRSFVWTYENERLCVSYETGQKEEERCLSKTSEASL